VEGYRLHYLNCSRRRPHNHFATISSNVFWRSSYPKQSVLISIGRAVQNIHPQDQERNWESKPRQGPSKSAQTLRQSQPRQESHKIVDNQWISFLHNFAHLFRDICTCAGMFSADGTTLRWLTGWYFMTQNYQHLSTSTLLRHSSARTSPWLLDYETCNKWSEPKGIFPER